MFTKINLQLFSEEEPSNEPIDGANEGVADPQIDNDDASNDGEDTGASDNDSELAEQKPKQSKEVDSAFAEMRRKAEAAEKKAQELEQQRTRDEQVRTQFAEYGVYSEADISKKFGASHGIHTFEDMQRAVLAEQYREKGIDPDEINKIIDSHPLIQEAQKVKENALIASQYNALVADLKEDGLETLVTKPDDIPESVYQKWNYGKSGLTLSECFYLSQRKQLNAKKIEATRQATLNNLNGKQHLKVEGDGGKESNDTHVPAETLQYFMDMGFSKKQALEHYKKLYGG